MCVVRYVRSEVRHDEGLTYPDAMGRHTVRLLRRLSYLAMEDLSSASPPAAPLLRYLEDEGIHAILAVPIRQGEDLVGFFTFESTTGPRAWDPGDRDHAAALAHRVARLWSMESNEGRDAAKAPGGPTSGGSPRALPPSVPPAAPPASHGLRPEELRLPLRRLRTMEALGILGLDLAGALGHLLEVQSATLSLLDDLLEDGAEGRGLLRDAREAGEEMRAHVGRTVEWSRGGADTRRPLELNDLMGALAGRLGKVTGDRVGLVLRPAVEPLRIRGQAALLHRAMEHLVRNAREASPDGNRVRVAVSRAPGSGSPGIAQIVVEDHGEGISGRDLPWIFEPFFTTRRDRGGEGMGLPFVQAVVEGHGGWVDVHSDPEAGTRFTLRLPLAEEAEEGGGAPGDGGISVPDPVPVRPLALLVEDDPALARLLERVLERSGFRTQRAEGAPAAERILQRAGADVALVVVERTLIGGEEGLALIRRARHARPHLTALLVDRRRGSGSGEPVGEGRGDAPQDGSGPGRGAGAEGPGDGTPEIPELFPPFEPAELLAVAQRLREAVGDAHPAREPHGPDPIH